VNAATTPGTIPFVDELLTLAEAPLPPHIWDRTVLAILNVLATSVGASRHPAVEIVCRFSEDYRGGGTVPVPGRTEGLDPLSAALAVGLAAHIDDFDDTHLETVLHPSAATLGAAWPLAIARRASGERFVTAIALGIEAQLRVGAAVSPWHYDEGWHITGTCGPIGAALTASILMDLPRDRVLDAVGIAASSTLGIREGFGTMMKPFHPGKAAENGVLAALLAEQGVSGPQTVLEAPRGFFRVLSPEGSSPERLTDRLGGHWELELNTYKPYPCGIVSHPSIDAALELAGSLDDIAQVVGIVAHVHPLAIELTGNATPVDGLQARFSTAHGIAAGLADGAVGLQQYEDTRVRSDDLVRLRGLVRLVADTSCARDEAHLCVELASGQQLLAHVPHARGSHDRPLTDDEVLAKMRGLIEPVLPGASGDIVSAVYGLETAESIDQVVWACRPKGSVG
jgi:2-methylcitrate dehydratase PrpD